MGGYSVCYSQTEMLSGLLGNKIRFTFRDELLTVCSLIVVIRNLKTSKLIIVFAFYISQNYMIFRTSSLVGPLLLQKSRMTMPRFFLNQINYQKYHQSFPIYPTKQSQSSLYTALRTQG